jgi:ribosomal protein L16 Arg81 hydroxylase
VQQTPAETFEWLIHPVTPRDFEQDYYERRVLVVSRGTPGYYQRLLSVADLDAVLATHNAKHPDIQITQYDKEIPAGEYTNASGVVDPLRAARLFSEGATLIFPHLQMRVPALAELCAALSRRLSSRMQTNIYFTPPEAQGFKPHWDTHDVFVLQVAGSKRWSIFDTKIPLPLLGQKFEPERDRPGDVTQEFELAAGDMVYIPRGLMHAARSTADPSLHITVGLMAYTWADFFLQAVAAAGLADAALRENLPLGFSLPSYPAEEKARLLREKLGRVAHHLDSAPPFNYFEQEVMSHNRPSFVNLLAQSAQLRDITLSSTLRQRAGAAWHLEKNGQQCVVRCYGNRIELPAFVSPAIEFMRGADSFRVGEMPDCVDGPGKVTLARRLVKEGLFECVELASPARS